MKSRVTASKERLAELEKQVKTLEAVATKRKALEDKTEAMKLALARKDALLRSHKDQLEALRVELLSLQEVTASRKADGDKHMRWVMGGLRWSPNPDYAVLLNLSICSKFVRMGRDVFMDAHKCYSASLSCVVCCMLCWCVGVVLLRQESAEAAGGGRGASARPPSRKR